MCVLSSLRFTIGRPRPRIRRDACGSDEIFKTITICLLYNKVLLDSTKRVCVESMKNSVENAVRENGRSRDLAVALDGSWQRRGYSSLNGLVR